MSNLAMMLILGYFLIFYPVYQSANKFTSRRKIEDKNYFPEEVFLIFAFAIVFEYINQSINLVYFITRT